VENDSLENDSPIDPETVDSVPSSPAADGSSERIDDVERVLARTTRTLARNAVAEDQTQPRDHEHNRNAARTGHRLSIGQKHVTAL